MKNRGVIVPKKTRMKHTWDDRIFDFVCNLFLVLFVIVVFYPIYFVLVASFSDPTYVNSGTVLLYPKGFTLDGYRRVFEDKQVWISYANTILYTVSGTVLGTAVIVMAGYAFSRKDLLGRDSLMKIFVFTMYFGGGMIPTFLVVNKLGMVGSRLSVIILGSVSVYNMIVVRSFMNSNIPDELFEAATIDGCGNGTFFVKVVVPLSKAVIAVMVLYAAVAYWNSYFNAMLYLVDSSQYPLQLYLRQILFQVKSSVSAETIISDPEYAERLQTMSELIKYSMITVATVPILCVYPFVQKYFVKGVMVGSVKG